MLLKNKTRSSPPSSQALTSDLQQPRSLRLRLMLWYGLLVAIVLLLFVVLVWKLTAGALAQSVDSAVNAEVRVVGLALSHKLSSTAPYWPSESLSLQVVDVYRDPGIAVKIVDAQGKVRYDSEQSTTELPLSAALTRAALSGQTAWVTTTVENGRVRV